ncbi:protein adenylyltransferase SelO family protein [Bacteriovoracaceae bacterium]|nr:protein adenylyltransferase SelO family protein [Bacteriovoracaceae bacterium]
MNPKENIFYQAIAPSVYYSLMDKLTSDPNSTNHETDTAPRQVTSGHYVLVSPTPLPEPQYVAHSSTLFKEFDLAENLATTKEFLEFFSGDIKQGLNYTSSGEFRTTGWASGYALSIMGQELYSQCPFGNGNGYGDGRAISILELKLPELSKPTSFFGTRGSHRPKRWEFQLKGGGRTPYCRGGDGRAVLRSSVREFIVSEAMACLGVPTTRALSLIVSKNLTIDRPWYSEGSRSEEPDMMVENPAAITTRVSSSFLRVGQIELFGRRARKDEHQNAMKELSDIVKFVIENEYPEIQTGNEFKKEVLMLVEAFGKRLAKMVGHWIRVGYCQGNFNSDNCAVGGFTLDYGPFGFMEEFDPNYQPWTGGGVHYSFLQQPNAAIQNFKMFCVAVSPLLTYEEDKASLQSLLQNFPNVITSSINDALSSKMGLNKFNPTLFESLIINLKSTPDIGVDWTIFWRELSKMPRDGSALTNAFYSNSSNTSEQATLEWTKWLNNWHTVLANENIDSPNSYLDSISDRMKRVNPKYVPREWMLVKAYKDAENNDYTEIHALQELFNNNPYSEQSPEIENRYYKKVDPSLKNLGGYSKMSCSS